MKNEDKGKNKGKLKYIGVVVVVVFLAGIYLVSATTVITDIQMTLEKVGVGNTKIGGGFIEVDDSSGSPIFCVNSTSGNVGIGTSNPLSTLAVDGNANIYCSLDPDSYIKLEPSLYPTCNSIAIKLNEHRNHNYLILSAYDEYYGNILYSRDPQEGRGQGFGIAGGDWMAPFDRFVVNSDDMFLGYCIKPGDGTSVTGGDGSGNLYVRGKVGIGTTEPNPNAKLEVKGGRVYITDDYPILTLDNEGGTGPDIWIASSNFNPPAGDFMIYQASPSPTKRILSYYLSGPKLALMADGGDVGIGTTDPKTTLDVDGLIRTRAGPKGTCDVNHAGAIAYEVSGGVGDFWGCKQTIPTPLTFAWVKLS